MSRSAANQFEIVIVGGGLAGACIANLLVRGRQLSPERLLILEPRPPVRKPAGADIDLRVSAISRASERILAACGVWEKLRAGRISVYERMCVWDEGSSAPTLTLPRFAGEGIRGRILNPLPREAGEGQGGGGVTFDCSEIDQPNLGHIIENSAMQMALLEQARQAGVKIFNTEVAGLTARDAGINLQLREGQELEAGLVIAADGADSKARQMMGIQIRNTSYRQRAIVTHIRTSRPHERTAWQRFLSTGPIALLPLHESDAPAGEQDKRSSIVWSTSEEAAKTLMANSDEEFCRAVEAATDGVLGTVESCAKRADFPLRSCHAEHYVLPGFALIGDAAHAIHPLAGQGVNLGFLDCAALAQLINEAIAGGEDAGQLKVLRAYERWRKGGNLSMLTAMEGLNRLFSNDNPTLGAVRRTGLGLVDRAGIVKTFFMRHALGLAGDLPDVARVATI